MFAIGLLGFRRAGSRSRGGLSHLALLALCAGLPLGVARPVAASHTFTTLDDPSVTGGTEALGIDGDTIVGTCSNTTGLHRFIVTVPEPAFCAIFIVSSLLLFARPRRGTA